MLREIDNMDKQYTFIFEYKGGTYIRQLQAADINKAVNIWLLVIAQDVPDLSAVEEKKLINEIKRETPTLLSNMDNVWQMFFLIGEPSSLLTIVLSYCHIDLS